MKPSRVHAIRARSRSRTPTMTWSIPTMPLRMIVSRVVVGKLSGLSSSRPEDQQRRGSMRFAWSRRLFQHGATSGIALMLASALALILANSPFAAIYDLLLSVHASVRIGDYGIEKPLLLWINDGLMAIFFLLVGLEI